VEGRRQRKVFGDEGRSRGLTLEAVSDRNLAREHLQCRKLLVLFVVRLLELVISRPKGVDFVAQRIVIRHFPGRAEITEEEPTHCKQSDESKDKDGVNRLVGDVYAS